MPGVDYELLGSKDPPTSATSDWFRVVCVYMAGKPQSDIVALSWNPCHVVSEDEELKFM